MSEHNSRKIVPPVASRRLELCELARNKSNSVLEKFGCVERSFTNRWLVLVVFLEPEPVSVPKRVSAREYLSFNVV